MTILDDAQYPVIEGLETFVVYLSSPHGAELAKPFQAIVAITDIFQDSKLSWQLCPVRPGLFLSASTQQEASLRSSLGWT